MSLNEETGSALYCSEGNGDKTVKKVIDYKQLNGKRYYKVKWECTWELEDSLFSCKDLVDQFWDFVNRVKSEDDNHIRDKKRFKIDEIVVRNNMNVEKNYRSEEEMPCVQIIPEENTSSEKEILSGNAKFAHFQVTDPPCRKPLVNIKSNSKEENVIDENNLPNLPSMVTINPSRQELQIPDTNDDNNSTHNLQHPSTMLKRTHETINHGTTDLKKSPDIIDLKLQKNINGVSSEERRFQCHVCGMAFKRKDMCKRHLRTHTNDCCYFCAICKKGFIRRYVLVKHLNKDHQTNDETKILSTKRRRREDVKQEPISKHHFLNREGYCMDVPSMEGSGHSSDTAENLSIDDEHDYDRKTEDVVVVFKVESSSDNKQNSNLKSSFYEKNNMEKNVEFPIKPSIDKQSYIRLSNLMQSNNPSEHNVSATNRSDPDSSGVVQSVSRQEQYSEKSVNNESTCVVCPLNDQPDTSDNGHVVCTTNNVPNSL